MVTSANSSWAWRRAVGGSIKCYKRPIEAILVFWLSEDYRTVVHKKVILPALFILTVLTVHAPRAPIPGIDSCLCPNSHLAQRRQQLWRWWCNAWSMADKERASSYQHLLLLFKWKCRKPWVPFPIPLTSNCPPVPLKPLAYSGSPWRIYLQEPGRILQRSNSHYSPLFCQGGYYLMKGTIFVW